MINLKNLKNGRAAGIWAEFFDKRYGLSDLPIVSKESINPALLNLTQSSIMGNSPKSDADFKYTILYIAPQWVSMNGNQNVPHVKSGFFRTPAFLTKAFQPFNRGNSKYDLNDLYSQRFYPIPQLSKKLWDQFLSDDYARTIRPGAVLTNNNWSEGKWCFGSVHANDLTESIDYMDDGTVTTSAMEKILIGFFKSKPNNDLSFDADYKIDELRSKNLIDPIDNKVSNLNLFFRAQEAYLQKWYPELSNDTPSKELEIALDKFWYTTLSSNSFKKELGSPLYVSPDIKKSFKLETLANSLNIGFEDSLETIISKYHTHNMTKNTIKFIININDTPIRINDGIPTDTEQLYALINKYINAYTESDLIEFSNLSINIEHPFINNDNFMSIEITLN